MFGISWFWWFVLWLLLLFLIGVIPGIVNLASIGLNLLYTQKWVHRIFRVMGALGLVAYIMLWQDGAFTQIDGGEEVGFFHSYGIGQNSASSFSFFRFSEHS